MGAENTPEHFDIKTIAERLTNSENGLIISHDVNFQPTGFLDYSTLNGNLLVPSDFLGISSVCESPETALKTMLDISSFSIRSRVMQAGLLLEAAKGVIQLDNGIYMAPVILRSINAIPITNVPEQDFPVARLFLEDLSYRLVGEELHEFAKAAIVGNNHLVDKERNQLQLSYKSENLYSVNVGEINLSAVLNVETREQLHTVLDVRPADVFNLTRGQHYLSSINKVKMPLGYILRLRDTPHEIFGNRQTIAHLPSTIIDQLFCGEIIVELTANGSEADPGSSNYISADVYHTNSPPH